MEKSNHKIAQPRYVFKYSPKVRKLSDIYYKENENGRRTQVIELHGMTKREAIEWSLYFIQIFHGQYVEFITGQGRHSSNGPVIKYAVQEMLQRFKIKWHEKPNNSGRICARL